MTIAAQDTFWHRLTSLRVGLGRVRLLTLSTQEELAALPDGMPCPLVLGNGTNLIGSDDDGGTALRLVAPDGARPELTDDGLLRLPAALPLTAALRQCADMGWGGLAALAGIPGTVGGAVAMNAGALGVEIGSAIEALDGWDLAQRQPWHWTAADGGFAYRRSPVPPTVVLLSCDLRLMSVEPAAERAAIEAELLRRRQANPQGASAGSVFQNPGNGLPPAGKLLDECGCKGLSVGNLQVSPLHANWIMNPTGKPAAAAHARELVSLARARVQYIYKITLHTEWRWA